MISLRFLQSWNGYDRGAEVPFQHPGLAEDLIRMGVAEAIRPEVAPLTPSAGTGAPADNPPPAAPVKSPKPKK